MTRVVLADDHPVFLEGLQALLASASDIDVVGRAETGPQAVDTVITSQPDVAILDLNMPGAYGFSGLVLLRGQYPHVPVVMISAQEKASIVARSREFGASGFIPKSHALETIQQAARLGFCWGGVVGGEGAVRLQGNW